MPVLVCKKCNGNHLTIKCGKEKKVISEIVQIKHSPKLRQKEFINKKLTCVKISNIPDDLTIDELNELMIEWGRIGKINFNKVDYNKSAFIDFYNNYEAEHFVKALDKTPFDNYILDVSILDN